MSSNGNPTNIVTPDGGNKMSAKEMFFKYLVYLPWFILSLAFAVTMAYMKIRYSVPLYNSSVSILIRNEKKSSAPNEISLDRLMLSNSVNLSNEIMVLKSASTMKRVVNTLGLELEYYNEGKIKKSELYTYSPIKASVINLKDSGSQINIVLTKQNGSIIAKWEGKTAKVNTGSVINCSKGSLKLDIDPSEFANDYKYFVYWKTDWDVASQLAGGLDVKQTSKDAGILQLNLITQIPDKGKDVLNQLVKEYDKLNIEEKNQIALSSIEFIDERLEILAGELGKVEDNLQHFEQSNKVVNLEEQGKTDYGKLTKLESNLSDQEVQMQVINLIREYVGNPSRRFQVVPSTLGISDPTLMALVANYNQLQLSRAQDLKSIKESHPFIKAKESQIEKVRMSILENLNNLTASARNLKSQTNKEYASTLSNLGSIPSKKRALLEINRQQSIKEKLYLYLLQKREEFAITKASTSGNVSAIDPANSWGPVSPNTTNIYRMAFILGLVVPIGFIYLRDLLNDKVVTRADLTKETAMPIIGEVAHHTSMTRKFVVGLKDRSVLAEQFRILRTNLQFLLTKAPSKNPVILVTSTIAGEGKTFCSMNMSAVWAVAGKKTVILELDLRKPKISKALSLQRDIGLTNYILGNARKEDLPQPNAEVPNLYIIGAGPIPPNPSEMIMDAKMDELFTYLRANFDIIIIDSAPVGLVSDSKILAKYADATLYVVRQRYTVKKQLSFINDLYEGKVLPNMGIIVNDVKIGGSNSYYGYGYGYGYGYSYNYNYSYSYGEKDKRTVMQKIRDLIGL
jgi:tyrosine-protein kinase Etk/Wzc